MTSGTVSLERSWQRDWDTAAARAEEVDGGTVALPSHLSMFAINLSFSKCLFTCYNQAVSPEE